MSKIKSIIFDFDGTLHDTKKLYTGPLRDGISLLRQKGYETEVFPEEVDEEYAKKFLGYRSEETFKKIAENAPDEIRDEVSRFVGKRMLEELEKGNGSLYKNTKKVLETLKEKGISLYILSNSGFGYLSTMTKYYDIFKYFDKIFPARNYGTLTKTEIIKKEIDEFEKDIMVVGDRFHDIEAGYENNLKTVFCKYGFGTEEESKNADYIIYDIIEILNIVCNIDKIK